MRDAGLNERRGSYQFPQEMTHPTTTTVYDEDGEELEEVEEEIEEVEEVEEEEEEIVEEEEDEEPDVNQNPVGMTVGREGSWNSQQFSSYRTN